LSGSPYFGSDEFISLLVKNVSLECPRQRVLIPSWNLSLVLSALKSHPFELAEEVDIKLLSYKCCFLLALASGRRRSEIHDYEFSEDIRVRLELDIALLNLDHEKGLESLSVLNPDQEFGFWLTRLNQLRE
jgi:hypothetical protein